MSKPGSLAVLVAEWRKQADESTDMAAKATDPTDRAVFQRQAAVVRSCARILEETTRDPGRPDE